LDINIPVKVYEEGNADRYIYLIREKERIKEIKSEISFLVQGINSLTKGIDLNDRNISDIESKLRKIKEYKEKEGNLTVKSTNILTEICKLT